MQFPIGVITVAIETLKEVEADLQIIREKGGDEMFRAAKCEGVLSATRKALEHERDLFLIPDVA